MCGSFWFFCCGCDCDPDYHPPVSQTQIMVIPQPPAVQPQPLPPPHEPHVCYPPPRSYPPQEPIPPTFIFVQPPPPQAASPPWCAPPPAEAYGYPPQVTWQPPNYPPQEDNDPLLQQPASPMTTPRRVASTKVHDEFPPAWPVTSQPAPQAPRPPSREPSKAYYYETLQAADQQPEDPRMPSKRYETPPSTMPQPED